MDLLRTVARPLLAAPFVIDGVDALLRPDSHVERMNRVTPVLEKAGMPPLLDSDIALATRVSGAAAVAAGACLAAGRAPRTSAALLAAMSVPLAVVNNPVWLAGTRAQRQEATNGLLRSLALGAGLALAAVDRQGAPSRSWLRAARRAERAQATQA